MIRRLHAALALAVVLGLPVAATRAEPEAAPPTWYAQVMARGRGGLNVTHFWSKGPKLRAETVVAGRKVVSIVSGDTYYAYDALGMVGVAIRRAPSAVASDSPLHRPFGHEHEVILRQGAEKVRQEEVQGYPTDVYRITDRQGMRQVWVTQSEPMLPVRIEIFRRATGSRHFTDYLNWQRGLPVADAFFEPEPAIELQRLELDEYNRIMAKDGSVGPVPILYADLLHGKRVRFDEEK